MDRRTLLRSAAVALPGVLAGCTTDALPGDGPESPPSSPSPSPPDVPPGTTYVDLVSRDDQPDLPLRYGVEVVDPAATGDHPPRVRVAFENAADHAVEVGEERSARFEHVTTDGPGLVLLSTGASRDLPLAGEECWRLTEPLAVAAYYGTIALEPGERRESTLGVFGTHDLPEGACLPSGEYRLGTTVRAVRDGGRGVDVTGDDARRDEWGFTLRVRRGDGG